MPLDELSGRLAYADERALVERAPALLADTRVSRSAAGRAGGRPAAGGADRTRPRTASRRRRRPAARPSPARRPPPRRPAAAQAAVRRPPVQPLPGDEDTTDDTRPVRIDVGRFEPRTVTPGAVVTVAGTLTNTGRVDDHRPRRPAAARRRPAPPAPSWPPTDRDPDPATTRRARLPAVPRRAWPPARSRVQLRRPRRRSCGWTRTASTPCWSTSTARSTASQRAGRGAVHLRGPAARRAPPRAPPSPGCGRWSSARTAPPPAASGTTTWPSRSAPGGGSTGPWRCSSGCRAPCRRRDRGGAPRCRSRWPSIRRWSRSSRSWPPAPTTVDGVEDAGAGTEAAAVFLDRLRAVADVHAVVALSYGDVGRRRAGRRGPDRRPGPEPARHARRAPPGPGGRPEEGAAAAAADGRPRSAEPGRRRDRSRRADPRRGPRRRAAHRPRLGARGLAAPRHARHAAGRRRASRWCSSSSGLSEGRSAVGLAGTRPPPPAPRCHDAGGRWTRWSPTPR